MELTVRIDPAKLERWFREETGIGSFSLRSSEEEATKKNVLSVLGYFFKSQDETQMAIDRWTIPILNLHNYHASDHADFIELRLEKKETGDKHERFLKFVKVVVDIFGKA